ncbi:hypothetical protein CAEBREN_13834 [Caenorhabditis brenneri]|uniref:F-box domain-containing protein n=1 Tax=Caenorhabditis brenneri TaxID=135651 RepID=G0N0J0_CAEBE|nr:hypothetical protein CAEBREN_13834 [Caenorhabditis brenneri]
MSSPTHSSHSNLLSLPDDEIVEKLRVMDLDQIIEVSLISERSKNLVKSLKIQGTSVHVDVKSGVSVSLFFEDRHNCSLKFEKINPTIPPSEVIFFFNTDFQYIEKTIRKDQFGIEDWMKHLHTIFNFRGIFSITLEAASMEYDPKEVKKYFGMPSEIDLRFSRNNAFNQSVLQTFLPVDSLVIPSDMFENSRIPPEVLIQNFTSLEITYGDPNIVTLDDLLMTNSKSIDIIESTQFEAKVLNKFIKLWQQGANPRMQHLLIYYETIKEDDEETILKGIKHKKNSNGGIGFFRSSVGFNYKNIWFSGGIDIVRKDGVKASWPL